MPFQELEFEALPELEGEYEYEGEVQGEHEGEGEYEAEQFFGQLARLAQSPLLRRVAQAAAQAALQGLGEHEYEGEFEGEGEGEFEYEGEYEAGPGRAYTDAMMEHMAHAAAEAANEHEAAEHFLPLIGLAAAKLLPLAAKAIPLAAKALPKIMSTVSRVSPNLTRGVTQMGRMLYRNPQTRPLVRVMPTVVRRTVGTIAQQAAQGQQVTPQQATRILARQANRVLRDPKRCVHAYRRSRKLDQGLHRQIIINIPR
jgi:hypothetical protein